MARPTVEVFTDLGEIERSPQRRDAPRLRWPHGGRLDDELAGPRRGRSRPRAASSAPTAAASWVAELTAKSAGTGRGTPLAVAPPSGLVPRSPIRPSPRPVWRGCATLPRAGERGSLRVMSEISRFFGIVIRIFYNDHAPPHVHAAYGDHEALFEIDTLKVMRGELPRRAHALVLEWAALHREELAGDWKLARSGDARARIAPLE